MMKILVAVKRVIDYKALIRIKPDGKGIDTSNVKMAMNPFDEIAVEEALRLKEKKIANEIVIVSIGNDACQETIRTALAMGADRGVLIKTDAEINPLSVAKVLKEIVTQENPTLIILGKQAIDSDDNQVGQMLAGLLNYSQGTFASKLTFREEGVSVTREIDGGLETILIRLPAVITTDLRLNEPRYISLPNIVQAKRKPITVIPLETLNISLNSNISLLKVAVPEKRRAGIKLEAVSDLVKRLKDEERVI